VFSHIRENKSYIEEEHHAEKKKREREKNSVATDKETHLLQKIILLSLDPMWQRIRFLGVLREETWTYIIMNAYIDTT
jgi:hypothetical protein